jgi:hypothetical protein
MEPTYFYFFVLPLAVLIVFLVALVLYLARKEESLYVRELKKLSKMLRSGTIDKKTFERMRNRLKEESIFTEELENLYVLVHDKTIDQNAYLRIRELLEKAFRQRVDALSDYT